MNRKHLMSLSLILFVSVALRVLAVVIVGRARLPWELEFEEIARNLIQYGTYSFSFYGLSSHQPSSFIPPVYPLFVAMARSLFPDGDGWVKAMQMVASNLVVWELYALTCTVGGSVQQGRLAAWLWAVYPPAIAYVGDLSTVTLETLFVVSGVWLLLRAVKRNALGLMIPAGVLWALAALTRATWLVGLSLAIVWLMWYLRKNKRVWGQGILLFGWGAAVTLAPWVIYNYQTHGVWLLTSTNGGLNFWIGNNPHATGEYVFPTTLDRDLVLQVADWTEVARDQFFYAQGIEFIRNSPGQFLSLVGRKLLYTLFFRPHMGSNYEAARIPLFDLATVSFKVAWLVLLPLAILGLFQVSAHWREHSLFMLIFFGNVATSVLYFSGTRFRTPVDTFVIIWAAMGLTALIQAWPRRLAHNKMAGPAR